MRTMIITVAGHKGGVGKTTVATSVATELFDRGHRVLLIDTDLPQASTLSWAGVAEDGADALPTVVGMKDNIAKQLRSMLVDYDHVVIDCPPRANKTQRAALIVADIALMPCGPSQYDVWALSDTLELFEEARSVRDDLLGAIVITKKDGRTKAGKTIQKSLVGHGVPVLRTEICNRIAYVKAAAAGTSVTRYDADSAAAREVRGVVDELEKLMPKETARVA